MRSHTRAARLFMLTNEDIVRSGATSIAGKQNRLATTKIGRSVYGKVTCRF